MILVVNKSKQTFDIGNIPFLCVKENICIELRA